MKLSVTGSSVTLDCLCSLLGDEYLSDEVANALSSLLSLRLQLSANMTTLIAPTQFAQNLTAADCFQGLATINGSTAVPYSSAAGAHKYLQKYGRWFKSLDRTHLYFVLYNPLKHWAACAIDFVARHVRFGDSLSWKQPKDFFAKLPAWLSHHFGEVPFKITDDLPCGHQTDRFNCLMFAINTVAHNALGDTMWEQSRARAMRMLAFCDIVKHSLSSVSFNEATHFSPSYLHNRPCFLWEQTISIPRTTLQTSRWRFRISTIPSPNLQPTFN